MPKDDIANRQIKEDLNGKPVLLLGDTLPTNEQLYTQTDFDKNYDYFHIMGHEETHSQRRRQILQAHPEIKSLMGPDYSSIWVSLSCILLLFTFAYYAQTMNLFLYVLTSYCIGGTFSHTCVILIHEFTHFTCFESYRWNKLLAIITNLPTFFPTATYFGRYHFDHHTFMNIKEKDPDIPSNWELKHLTTPFMKFMFIIVQPVFYGLRPLFIMYKPPSVWEFWNLVALILSDSLVCYYMGFWSMIWLMTSFLFGMSLHPSAGHIIAEHYEFSNRLETYDYIGIMNFFNINLGYHTEHHDFPMVPWTRLPIIRRMAPEFYECLPYHTSYIQVVYKQSLLLIIQQSYIFDGYVGPWSRIVRRSQKKQE